MSAKIKFLLGFLFFLLFASWLLWRFYPRLKQINPQVETIGQEKNLVLSLALLADVHNDWENLNQAVTMVNGQNYDLTLFLGDLTDVGDPDDFKTGESILNGLRIPLYSIPGNHDVWWARQKNLEADNFFNASFHSPVCITEKNLQLLLIDNADEKNGIDNQEWQEINQCLQTDLPIFAFTHEPLQHPASDYVMGKYSSSVATQGAQLLQILCDKKVKLVVAAHQHSFSKYFYSCPGGYQLPMLVIGAITSQRNFQSPRFLQLNLYDDASFGEKEIILEKN